MKNPISSVEPYQLAIIQFGMLKLVDRMITDQGLEKTLEDIRNVLGKSERELPREQIEEAWKSMLRSIKRLREALEEFKKIHNQEKKDNEK